MGALPSREANEDPSSFFFLNCNNLIVLHIPLTPHYFPSPDCLAFRQLFAARNNQSALYCFDVRRLEPYMSGPAAAAFRAAQAEDWGAEVRETDPCVHYYDDDDERAGDGGDDAAHVRDAIEDVAELYNVLVEQASKGQMTETNAEMCEVYEEEQRWRTARAELRRATCTSTPDVPPPRRFLRPLPMALAVRLTHAEEAAMREEYYRQHGHPDAMPRASSFATVSSSSSSSSTSRSTSSSSGSGVSKGAGSDVESVGDSGASKHDGGSSRASSGCGTPRLTRRRRYRFESDPTLRDGRVHLCAEDGVLYFFAYRRQDVDDAAGDAPTASPDFTMDYCHHNELCEAEKGRWRCVDCGAAVSRLAEGTRLRVFPSAREAAAAGVRGGAFVIPITAVRVIGLHGLLPAVSRGTPWLRGLEHDRAEDNYVESLPTPPPVMRLCRFIDCTVGEKILNRATLVSLLTYRSSCLAAGLPGVVVRPLWSTCVLSSIPYLQMVRETFLRAKAAMAEIDQGDLQLRRWIEEVEKENNFTRCLNTHLHTIKEQHAPRHAAARRAERGQIGRPEGHGARDCAGDAEVDPAPPRPDFHLYSSRLESLALGELGATLESGAVTDDAALRAALERYVAAWCDTPSPRSDVAPAAPLPRCHGRALVECGMVASVRGRYLLFRVREDCLRAVCDYCALAASPLFIGAYIDPVDTTTVSYGGPVQLLRRMPHREGGGVGSGVVYLDRPCDVRLIAEYVSGGLVTAFSVSDVAPCAAGPSARHGLRKFAPPRAAGELEVRQAWERGRYGHVYSYAVDEFCDGDLVVYDTEHGMWVHYEHAQMRRHFDVSVGHDEHTPCWTRLLLIGLNELLLSWTKWVVDNRFYEDRHDAGWLHHGPGDALIQAGRYFVWSFRHNNQRYFYGVIPKFAKGRLRRRRTGTHGSGIEVRDGAATHDAESGRSRPRRRRPAHPERAATPAAASPHLDPCTHTAGANAEAAARTTVQPWTSYHRGDGNTFMQDHKRWENEYYPPLPVARTGPVRGGAHTFYYHPDSLRGSRRVRVQIGRRCDSGVTSSRSSVRHTPLHRSFGVPSPSPTRSAAGCARPDPTACSPRTGCVEADEVEGRRTGFRWNPYALPQSGA